MQEYKGLLRIGEVAKICHISVKTLRFYDINSILKPVIVDSASQYRYYSPDQLPFLALIKELRACGLPLAEIREFFLDIEEPISKLDKIKAFFEYKEVGIAKKIENLLKIQEQLSSWKELCNIEKVCAAQNKNQISVKNIPARGIAFTRYRSPIDINAIVTRYIELTELIRNKNLGNRGPLMTIYYDDCWDINPLDADLEICLKVIADNHCMHDFIRELPAGLYVSTIHQGDVKTIFTETYPRIYHWIKEHGYLVIGPAIHIYLITSLYTKSVDKFATELQIPVGIQDNEF